MTGRLVTVQQVADACGVSPMSVYRMIDRGELTPVRVGKKTIRLDATQLDPVVQEILDVNDTLARVVALRDRWRETARYGPWDTKRQYDHRARQLTQALDGTLPPVVTPPQGDQP